DQGPAIALDLFYVRDLYGKVIAADDARWELVKRDLAAILDGPDEPRDAVAALIRRRRAHSSLRPRVTPAVPTQVQVVDDESDRDTIVEVQTRDRIASLHTITSTIAALEMDIHLPKVSTEGERVADAFYVT